MEGQPIRHNAEKRRYEATLNGATAVLQYFDQPDGTRVFAHTEVPAAFEGQGIGGRLVKTALDEARAAGKGVRPQCPFVRAYIERHPEYQDLVRSGA